MEQVAEPVSSALRDHDEDILSDDFRMSCMKVVPCSKRFVHDWTECPFAHPHEKARRRDPKIHSYTGIACPSMKKEGSCAFGDNCPYAHNVFEYWLHPTRYRTQLCNDGSNCRRKICFFAHSLDELRVPACKPFVSPEGLAAAAAAAASENETKRKSGVVGTPMANLNAMVSPTTGPSRVSVDSIRQSCEWGPVAMPSAGGGGSGSSDNLMSPNSPQDISPTDTLESPSSLTPSQHQTQHQVGYDGQQQQEVRFLAHEQQVIDAITNMLAENKLSASQAATILQQMLPANSLQLLQSRLGLGTSTEEASAPGKGVHKSISEPLVQQVHHQDQMLVSPSPRTSFDMTGGVAAARQSMESTRSSFDTARYSFDGGRRLSSDAFPSPRGSMEGYMQQPQQQQPQQQQQAYAPPAPAYPQDPQQQQQQRTSSDAKPPLLPQRYWTGQQLTTVPEGLPMINTPHSHLWGTAPVRHSTGSMGMGASNSGNSSVASRLSSDFNRMSFENAAAAAHGAGGAAEDASKVNPYASAFFSGGDQGGKNGAYDDYTQRPSW